MQARKPVSEPAVRWSLSLASWLTTHSHIQVLLRLLVHLVFVAHGTSTSTTPNSNPPHKCKLPPDTPDPPERDKALLRVRSGVTAISELTDVSRGKGPLLHSPSTPPLYTGCSFLANRE